MRAIIYYPYINPPQEWIKQALLYWDRVCTIIPVNYHEIETVLHPDLIWLRDRGIYEAITADDIQDHEKQNLRQEILKYLHSKDKIPIKPDDWSLTKKERIFYGKLPEEVEEDLKKAGHLKGRKNYLEINSDLFGVLLCLIAKYLSKSLTIRDNYYSIFTMGSEFEKCNFEPIYPDRSEMCIQVMLNNFLPVPSGTEPLENILEFKETNRGDLAGFRRALDSLYVQLAKEMPEQRILAAATDEISARLNEITRKMKERKIRTWLMSLSVIVGGVINWAIGESISTKIPQIMDTIPEISASPYLARPSNLCGDFSYLYRAIERF